MAKLPGTSTTYDYETRPAADAPAANPDFDQHGPFAEQSVTAPEFKRGPGRPPKAHVLAERQPGDDKGPAFIGDAEAKGNKFPVKLLKGYVPKGPYCVILPDQRVDVTPPPNAQSSILDKVAAGTTIEVDREEAKTIIAKKIGERADDMVI